MNKQFASLAAGIVAAFLFAGQINAQMMQMQEKRQARSSGMMQHSMQGGMMQGMMKMHKGFGFYLNKAEQLGLTGAQLKQLRNMKFAFDKAAIQRKATLETAKLELQQLKMAETIDAGKVEAKIREVKNRQADIEVALFQAKQKAKALLTEEQRAKVKSMSCAMCGQMHEGGKAGGMMKGMMGQGGMMQPGQQQKGSSDHEQHHKKN